MPAFYQRRIKELRKEYIDDYLKKGDHVKYIGELTRKELEDRIGPMATIYDSKLNGREVLVEYHLFMLHDKLPSIQQRRVVPFY